MNALMMTRQQRAALARPCLLAEETSVPRYFTETALGTVVLTINTGFE